MGNRSTKYNVTSSEDKELCLISPKQPFSYVTSFRDRRRTENIMEVMATPDMNFSSTFQPLIEELMWLNSLQKLLQDKIAYKKNCNRKAEAYGKYLQQKLVDDKKRSLVRMQFLRNEVATKELERKLRLGVMHEPLLKFNDSFGASKFNSNLECIHESKLENAENLISFNKASDANFNLNPKSSKSMPCQKSQSSPRCSYSNSTAPNSLNRRRSNSCIGNSPILAKKVGCTILNTTLDENFIPKIKVTKPLEDETYQWKTNEIYEEKNPASTTSRQSSHHSLVQDTKHVSNLLQSVSQLEKDTNQFLEHEMLRMKERKHFSDNVAKLIQIRESLQRAIDETDELTSRDEIKESTLIEEIEEPASSDQIVELRERASRENEEFENLIAGPTRSQNPMGDCN